MWEPPKGVLLRNNCVVVSFCFSFSPLFRPPGYCTLKCDVRYIESSQWRYFIVRKCLVFSRQTPHWITGDSFKCTPAIHSHENTNACIESGRIFTLCAEKYSSLTSVVLKVGSREPSGFLKKAPNVQSCFWGLYRQDYTRLTIGHGQNMHRVFFLILSTNMWHMAGTKSIAAPLCSELVSHIRIVSAVSQWEG